MNLSITNHLRDVSKHLYINPLEQCNLRCAICYTPKTIHSLTERQILSFVKKYNKSFPLETITFCGGEVFLLTYMTTLINTLTHMGIIVQVITNGTIDKLEELSQPNTINIIVSLDGTASYHDTNRGKGMFAKSLAFLQKARGLGFHTEIFSIATKENSKQRDEFESCIKKEVGENIPITYHPRKPPEYLANHPTANRVGETKGFSFLSNKDIASLMKSKNTFPPKQLGCYQISLMSDGSVYGCCEGIHPIGTIHDTPDTLMKALSQKLQQWDSMNPTSTCLGCSEPTFICGMKEAIPKKI